MRRRRDRTDFLELPRPSLQEGLMLRHAPSPPESKAAGGTPEGETNSLYYIPIDLIRRRGILKDKTRDSRTTSKVEQLPNEGSVPTSLDDPNPRDGESSNDSWWDRTSTDEESSGESFNEEKEIQAMATLPEPYDGFDEETEIQAMEALSEPYDLAHPSLDSQMHSEWSPDSGEDTEKNSDMSVPILHPIPPSLSCGRYNFQGCSRKPCEHEHVWDRGAQVAMAEMLCKSNR